MHNTDSKTAEDQSSSELTQALAELVSGLFKEHQTECSALYERLKDVESVALGLDSAIKLNPERFRLHLTYTLDKLQEGVVLAATGFAPVVDKRKLVSLFLNYGFFASHIRALVEEVEGSACCADKTRFLLKALARFFAHGQEVSFDRNQPYTFHLPEKVLTSHQEVVDFYNALERLFYGKPDKYLPLYAQLRSRGHG